MGNIIDFVKNNWIVVILVTVVIFSLIGYLIEKHNLNQNKQQVKGGKTDKDLSKLIDMPIYHNDEIVYENVKEDNNAVIPEKKNKQETNKLADIDTEQEIKESIDEIIENKNMTLDETDKAILEKSAVEDLKDEFEDLDYEIDTIKKPKIKTKVDTNIELPEINIADDKDIWN